VLFLAGIYAENAGKCRFSGISGAARGKNAVQKVPERSSGGPEMLGANAVFFENFEKMPEILAIFRDLN